MEKLFESYDKFCKGQDEQDVIDNIGEFMATLKRHEIVQLIEYAKDAQGEIGYMAQEIKNLSSALDNVSQRGHY